MDTSPTPIARRTSILDAVDPAPRAAWWVFWLTVLTLIFGTAVGGTWDRIYHGLVPFDGFWSPPHLVVYASGGIAALLVMAMIYTPRLRAAFGHRFDVKILPLTVGGGLVLLGCGLAILGFAGAVLDNFWHTQFGLDETSWSFPHSMLGWSLILITLGVASTRMSMARPCRWYTHMLLTYLVLTVSLGTVLGPLSDARTLESLELVYQLPGLSVEEPQHTYRIYRDFNLTRTNPLLLILAPLWFGAALAFSQGMDRRWWVMLPPLLVIALGDNAEDTVLLFEQVYATDLPAAASRALPIILPLVVWMLLRWRRVPPWWNWGISGGLFALMLHNTYDMPTYGLLLLPISVAVTLLGAWLGRRIHAIVQKPDSFDAVRPLLLMPLVVPLFTGIVDLYLRFTVP